MATNLLASTVAPSAAIERLSLLIIKRLRLKLLAPEQRREAVGTRSLR